VLVAGGTVVLIRRAALASTGLGARQHRPLA